LQRFGFYIPGNNITDEGIKGMPLTSLSLWGNKNITDKIKIELENKGCIIYN
jgi:hypothetical protein